MNIRTHSYIKLYLVFLICSCFAFHFSLSCSCIPPKNPREELNTSSAVFSGRVIMINQVSEIEKQVKFCIKDIWKGTVSKYYQVKTCVNSACCGFDFEFGKTYLVYAHRQEGRLWVSLCSRTKNINYADEDLNALPVPIYSNNPEC